VQIVRGPAFFEQRTELIDGLVAQLTAADVKPAALARAGGDVEVVREQVRGVYLAKTHQLVTMLNTSFKIASVIGSMRWHLLRFPGPLLAYSDHPVVLWPMDVVTAAPFTRQHLAPLSAIEVRVPIAPDMALLMTWADVPDASRAVSADARYASEINAFTIAQAERQWMHKLGHEPPVGSGTFAPLTRSFEPGYTPAIALQSRRRTTAARYLHRVRNRSHLSTIEIVDLQAQTT
jgi:hypothetical protein